MWAGFTNADSSYYTVAAKKVRLHAQVRFLYLFYIVKSLV